MNGDVILKHDDAWLKFTRPRRVIVTDKLEDVRKALDETERLVDEYGWHAAGFVSYEAAPAFDPSLRVIPSRGFPLLWFGLYDAPHVIETSEVFKDFGSPMPLNWQPNVDKDTYNSAIQTIKERIAQGKTYQVNYTMRLISDAMVDPWTLFLHLARSQNKYAAFVDIGDWAICSASHELFFELDGDVITGRPMKGTVKRGRTTKEDDTNSDWLHASLKNRAENVMIVDMIRNDLGRIAEVGSVHVPELFTIEKYPTLFQMTSTVKAKTKASVTRIFSALFPCASITGAPKVSTMRIIEELETSPRNIYTGSIGYIAPNRKARFNVAIRTALVDKVNRKAEYGVGGGIVWDSTSADEYSEALLKARVLTDPPQREFSLFETLLWTPEEGWFLLERHIARMMDSAEYFDFPFSEDGMKKTLNQMIETTDRPQRVKLLLDAQGNFSGEVKEFQADDKVFKVCLATDPVDSNNRFLFHKTTKRDVYDQAAIKGCDDVLLFNENGELTEFTIGNLVVKMDGELFTPPIECGLLAGTFRAELLASGEVKERVIPVANLGKCEAVFLVNSLRKWVKVEMKKEPSR
ncbi:MAG TPA: aminodeoxychorismate synthase component I [Anaerolineales bacterium]|nr:aminodeoxychorismate synthase component I [Anaerolineales bacterium]